MRVPILSGKEPNSRLKRVETTSSVNPMTINDMPILSGKESRKTFNWGKDRDKMPRMSPDKSSIAKTGALNWRLKENILEESSIR